MSRSSIQLDRNLPLEAPAAVLAIIAWPDRQATVAPEAQAALVRHLLEAAAEADPKLLWRPIFIKPGYLLMPPRRAEKLVADTCNRLQEALLCARIARPFIRRVIDNFEPSMPSGLKKLSLNNTISFVLGDKVKTDPHNFEQRVFRRTGPVLHLAVALEQTICAAEGAFGKKLGLEQFLLEPLLLADMVRRAERLEPLMLPAFRVKPDRMLRVRFRN